jgi:hypothetical protein
VRTIDAFTAQTPKLPPTLTAEHEIDGCSNKIWIAHPVEGADRAAVEEALQLLELRLVPATDDEALTLIAEMLEHYGKTGKISPEIFTRHIGEFSAYHIAAILKAHIAANEQLPMPATFRLQLTKLKSSATVMLHRAKVLLGLKQAYWFETPDFAASRVKKQRYRMAG